MKRPLKDLKSEQNALRPVEAEQPTHQLRHADDGARVDQGMKPAHPDPAIKKNESEKDGRDAEPKKQNQQKIQDERKKIAQGHCGFRPGLELRCHVRSTEI